MGFAKFSSDFLIESFTLVDNLFINEHLPYCDEKQIKVYLYGLYMCTLPQKGNTTEAMCAALNLTETEIADIYRGFEDAGLCRLISTSPLEVSYLSLKGSSQPPKKYKSEKWHDFNRELQSLFPERMITPNEYNEYYAFLDANKLDRDAMLMIVQYCINLKGDSVRYPYILTVARNWVADGVRTVADVENKLNEYEAQTDDMRAVLSALGRKTGAELEEKQMLLKWTRSWGFELPAILAAAKSLKGGKSFKKLDRKLDEFYRMSVFTAEEMADCDRYRERMQELAVKINRNIGVFYESLDHIVEVYTIPWTNKGFSDDALVTIAHYCFLSGIRSLDGMNSVVNKFFAQGLLTVEAIDDFISVQVGQDERIKTVIEACGRSRNVTASDRDFYRTWTASWGFDDDVILLAAEMCAGKPYPTSAVNRLLSEWKSKGVKTIEAARKQGAAVSSPESKNFAERTYTDDQLQAVFTSIDSIKDTDL